MSEFKTVAKVGAIPEGEGRTFTVDGRVVGVFLIDGEYFAINDLCPHMGASLASGHVEDHAVTCPWHAWRFDLTTGSCTWAPDYETVKDTRLTRLKVSLEAGSYRIHPPGPREA